MGPEERKVTLATIPDLVVDLRALTECVAKGNLTDDRHMADAETTAPGPQYARPGSEVEARQEEVEYLVIDAFAEMSSDVDALADVTESASSSLQALRRRRACTSSASRRHGATRPTGGGPTSCLTAPGTSLSTEGNFQRR